MRGGFKGRGRDDRLAWTECGPLCRTQGTWHFAQGFLRGNVIAGSRTTELRAAIPGIPVEDGNIADYDRPSWKRPILMRKPARLTLQRTESAGGESTLPGPAQHEASLGLSFRNPRAAGRWHLIPGKYLVNMLIGLPVSMGSCVDYYDAHVNNFTAIDIHGR